MRQSIEVVIPVHDPARPVARGIASVMDQRPALALRGVDLHVTVVLHNLAAASLSQPGFPAGLPAATDGVTYLTHNDGVPSPAGPRNYALGRSSATGFAAGLVASGREAYCCGGDRTAADTCGQHSRGSPDSTVKAPGPPPPP
jgi:hypothetical protein